ncbi:receptor-type tyrosine-protein phosphatase alpha-like [Agrilus planipennis]|uniref:Receptor-type tyrosine-protein phosphatase alpha-like n=1 Tax=Agrilus planipennis TaxID=224129 RepID=A0A1W4XA92_AGRPL|nr:receptor-type tyrosine-protein phosphatase alpha-like [Agrilus planipennis]
MMSTQSEPPRKTHSSTTNHRKHRSRSTPRFSDSDKPKKKRTLTAATSLVSIPNTIKLSMLNSGLLSTENENGSMLASINEKAIPIKEFPKFVDQRRKFPVLFKLEFQVAIKVEQHSCRHASKKANLKKNQNQRCIPYDYNRVVLEKVGDENDSDYINASYVDVSITTYV